jgi:D-3-phosphoglycerate dehydrogenase
MVKVLKLNEISPVANKVFPKTYDIAKDIEKPEGIMLRSFNMHEYPLNDELLAIARAGAGTNNIPLDKCSAKGIVVFNTPGANANAVKELVISALLMSSRKIVPAIEWAKTLKGKGEEVAKLVEKGKNNFVGPEIYGKKLGVIGLGAIGALVANAAISLGMDVLGYDPYISVDNAWTLSRGVKRITDFTELLKESDYITIHVPLTSTNKYMFNEETFNIMKSGSVLINCSRGELVNNADVISAVSSGKLARHVTDFPCDEILGIDNIICIPHLGASTPEAEDNCAYMAAQELVDYIDNGNITHSVNFPDCHANKAGTVRITLLHLNQKEMLSKITAKLSSLNLNIANLINKSQGEYAYSIVDLDSDINNSIISEFMLIDGIIKVRIIR